MNYCIAQHTLDYYYVCIYCEFSRTALDKSSTQLNAEFLSAFNCVEFLVKAVLVPENDEKSCALFL